jgi:hypothetical protein
MNQLIPAALTNTVLLADHDEALQRQVVDAVEKIIANYLQNNMHTVGSYLISMHKPDIERIALRAVKQHFINASNIY